ncbi:hypothetical protein GSF22_33565, partial [Micromonospora echinofusca]|nr:hypothetical protein [Micromonospora echinofusca]
VAPTPGVPVVPGPDAATTVPVVRQRWRWWIPALATALAATVGMSTAMAVTWEQTAPSADPPAVPADLPGSAGPAATPTGVNWRPPGHGPNGEHDVLPPPPPGVPPPPFACVRPSHAGRLVPAGPQPPGERYRPPAGWTWYRDRSGFRIVVPVGWWQFQEEGVTCFQDPRHSRALSIDPRVPRTGDPLAALKAAEQWALGEGALIQYEPIRLTATREPPGAAWECRWTVPYGERMHSVQLAVSGKGSGSYRLGWTTGEAYWAEAHSELATVLASYRPPA